MFLSHLEYVPQRRRRIRAQVFITERMDLRNVSIFVSEENKLRNACKEFALHRRGRVFEVPYLYGVADQST